MASDRRQAAQPQAAAWPRRRLAGFAMIVAFLGLPLATGSPARAGTDDRAATQPAAGAASGSVRGVVRLGRNLTERRMRFTLYTTPGAAAAVPPSNGPSDEMPNVIVYLDDAPELHSGITIPARPFRIEQSHVAFQPHVLPVVAGTTVEFPNVDAIYHNVFSLSKSSSFDLGRYPKGSSRQVTFGTPGLVKVFCHIHSDMSAVVMVLPHPYFATPDGQGAYVIEGIPPGHYRIIGWHERARPIHRDLLVEAGVPAEINLDIPIEDPPDGR